VIAARITSIPSIVHIGGGELVAIADIHYGGRLTWRGRLREALVLRAASAVTAASGPIIDSLRQLGIEAQRIPLGVDLVAWPPREPVRHAIDRPASSLTRGTAARLIHVASLNRVKDQRTLLYALAALDRRGIEFEMTIVGEDTLRGEIQALATSLGLDEK